MGCFVGISLLKPSGLSKVKEWRDMFIDCVHTEEQPVWGTKVDSGQSAAGIVTKMLTPHGGGGTLEPPLTEQPQPMPVPSPLR